MLHLEDSSGVDLDQASHGRPRPRLMTAQFRALAATARDMTKTRNCAFLIFFSPSVKALAKYHDWVL